jgi:AraC-like DNA-binding protein
MYQLRPPAPQLARYIEHYWFVHATPTRPFNLSVDVFVDARADLVFNFGVAYARKVLGGRTRTLKASNLDAQRLRPIRISQSGHVVISGVRFHTGGLSAFVSRSVHVWNDKVVPVASVFDATGPLEEALRRAGDRCDAQKEAFDAYFGARLDRSSVRTTFDEIKTRIECEDGPLRVDALCERAGISIRQLDRLFRKNLGFGPKTFSRIVRFQRALARIKRHPDVSIAQVAAECGYYDQSHFVRECKAYAGAVPTRQVGYFPADAPTDFSPNLVQYVQDSLRK